MPFIFTKPFLGLLALWLFFSTTTQAQSLSLEAASQQLLQQHPQLQAYAFRLKQQEIATQQAKLRPQTSLDFTIDQIAGTGEYQGIANAETTLALSSVFELGNKRQTRNAYAQSNYALAQSESELNALNLMADLTREFISALALKQRCNLSSKQLTLAKELFHAVDIKKKKAAITEADYLRSQVDVTQAEIALAQCQTELSISYQRLSASMGQSSINFDDVTGDLFTLPEIANVTQMQQQLEQSATLRMYAQQSQQQAAELALAKSTTRADIQWQLGISHYAASDDAALSVGVSLPLMTGKRNANTVQQLQLQQAALGQQQQSQLIYLKTQLLNAFMQQQQSRNTLIRLENEIIPLLNIALQHSQRAYLLGRYSYSDYLSARNVLLNAQLERINYAESTLLNRTLIEQLTGHALP